MNESLPKMINADNVIHLYGLYIPNISEYSSWVGWIKAQEYPLLKKGDKTDPANYRPISLTCKVMEHVQLLERLKYSG